MAIQLLGIINLGARALEQVLHKTGAAGRGDGGAAVGLIILTWQLLIPRSCLENVVCMSAW